MIAPWFIAAIVWAFVAARPVLLHLDRRRPHVRWRFVKVGDATRGAILLRFDPPRELTEVEVEEIGARWAREFGTSPWICMTSDDPRPSLFAVLPGGRR